jgi:hypothetical protein
MKRLAHPLALLVVGAAISTVPVPGAAVGLAPPFQATG